MQTVMSALQDGSGRVRMRMTAGQRRAVLKAKLTDLRPLHLLERDGWRPYLLLVVDGRVSVVRLGLIVDRGQGAEAISAALDAAVEDWRRRLDHLTVSQLVRFHAAVAETTDPYLLLEAVVSEGS